MLMQVCVVSALPDVDRDLGALVWLKLLLPVAKQFERDCVMDAVDSLIEFDVFETSRLRAECLAPCSDDHEPCETLRNNFYAILTPNVVRYLPAMFSADHQHRNVTEWVRHRQEIGSVFLITHKQSEQLIGALIISSQRIETRHPVANVGYLLAEKYWGQGLASELLEGLIERLPAGRNILLLGNVERANLASAKVLKKCGFEEDPILGTTSTRTFARLIEYFTRPNIRGRGGKTRAQQTELNPFD